MKVNGHLVSDLRKRCSWSQDELAMATGLSMRTIQRIENDGSASLQSLKAIASALEVGIEDLEGPGMSRFEYKTIVLPFRVGIFKQGLPDIQTALDSQGAEGWKFKQMILPSSSWGTSDTMVAILERTVDQDSTMPT